MSDRVLTLDNLLALREMAPDLAITRAIGKFTGNEADLDEVTQVCQCTETVQALNHTLST